jgi:4-hydroxybenzoate polyprenyltransferase
MQWFIAMRPLCGTSTALLVISGFRHGHQPIDWSVVVAVFFLTSMAMLLNDYHDRELDVAKGRLLASRHPVCFLWYALAFATISFGLSILVWFHNPPFGMLCMGMWITSVAYNKAQSNPVAKNLIVSLNVGATVIFPLLAGSKTSVLWFMAGIIVVVITAREFVKDLEDMEFDRGKKRTLALVMDCRFEKSSVSLWKLFLTLLLVTLMF